MGAANRDGHPSDSNGDRIGAKRAKMERLDEYAFVKTEMPQARSVAIAKTFPVDRRDPCAASDLELIEGDIGHIATDYH
jgi:hypothetical protein